jgi:hypothetical protein
MVLVAALIVAAAVVFGAFRVASALNASPPSTSRARVLEIMTLFAPAVGAAQQDPRALLVWEPLARMARRLFPEEFAALDRAAGARFPFTTELVQAAHARWTSDWLAWERTHDAEYKLKAVAVEEELGGSASTRAKLDSIEREKLELYQRRYEEYVRVAKALQALESAAASDAPH